MSLIALRTLLDHAAEHDYGVPAFNINNMEQINAIMQAADRRFAGDPAVVARRAVLDLADALARRRLAPSPGRPRGRALRHARSSAGVIVTR